MSHKPVAALIAVLVAAGSTTGAAAASTHAAKAEIQGGNSECGADHPEDPTIGKVTFKRKTNTVTIKAALKGARPNTFYELDLYGDGCTGIAASPAVETNKKGVAKLTLTAEVPAEDTQFFAAAWNTSEAFASDTPYVTLLP
jgi:hypothetical protein